MFNRNKNYQETGTEYAALTAVFNLIIFTLTAVALYAGFSLLTQLGGLIETLTFKMPMLLLLAGFGGVVATTAQTATDEQLIRELIRQEAAGKRNVRYAENAVFASDVLPRPVVLKNTREPETVVIQTVAARRHQILKIEVRRIAVAESKDIAYEYSDFTISYDQPDTTRDGYTGSMLRVWQKTNGEWRVDAAFLRQNTDGENPVKN